MSSRLTEDKLRELVRISDISGASFTQIVKAFLDEPQLKQFAPDPEAGADPRSGIPVLYNSKRARRPEDFSQAKKPSTAASGQCVICAGRTTGVLDLARQSSGFTFINKNLFPIAYPRDGAASFGLHFLQWTSTFHDRDWHNLSPADCTVAMARLAVLEKKLLTEGDAGGHVCIIKNYGPLVGGSLSHGHQQIIYTRVTPRAFEQDREFERKHEKPFTAWLLERNPARLMIRDYGPVALVTPFFMQRPFDMFLVVKDSEKKYLYELDGDEMEATAAGWRDAAGLIQKIMPLTGRQTAYNVTCHNGPSKGLYFEFLPYTQEFGGFERLGLYCCQNNPGNTAEILRGLIH